MHDLPGWFQGFLGSGALLAAWHGVKFAWPWLVKGGKFAFGLLAGSSKEQPQVVVQFNGAEYGPRPPALPPGEGRTSTLPSTDLAAASLEMEREMERMLEAHKKALDEHLAALVAARHLVSREELVRAVRECAARECVPRGEHSRLEGRFQKEEAENERFREMVVQKLAVLIDRTGREPTMMRTR